jgi:UDP-N-acetylmuramoylalanine--D-glutamate ligase
VVPGGDAVVDRVVAGAVGQRLMFGVEPSSLPGISHTLWITDGRFTGVWNNEPIDLGPVDALRLPGEHSRLNVLAAAGAALAIGVTPDEIARAIAGFGGVPHRMEHVATIKGVEFINDTAATAPAAAVAALSAFAGRQIVAIAGGFDKKLPIEPLVDALVERADRVILLDGTLTPTLHDQLVARRHAAIDGPYSSMEEAVRQAADVATPGAVVLLSPGTASFGMFRDEFHRGEMFRAAVSDLQRKERE